MQQMKLNQQTHVEMAKIQFEREKLQFEREKLQAMTTSDKDKLETQKQLEKDKLEAKIRLDKEQLDLQKLQMQLNQQTEDTKITLQKTISEITVSGNLEKTNLMIQAEKQLFELSKKQLDEVQRKITYEENKSAIIIGRLQIILFLIVNGIMVI
jgi:hypothetical protein